MDLLRSDTALSIVPQPPPPGLYLTLGPEGLCSWALESLTRTLASPSRIVWVDAANAFNAYLVAMAARSVLKDPREALRAFQVARPFTAYQLEVMVTEKTRPAVERLRALVAVVADPLRLFAEAEGRDTQLRLCYQRFLAGLKALAQNTAVVVLSSSARSAYTGPLLSAAGRITRLGMEDQRRVLSLVSSRDALADP